MTVDLALAFDLLNFVALMSLVGNSGQVLKETKMKEKSQLEFATKMLVNLWSRIDPGR